MSDPCVTHFGTGDREANRRALKASFKEERDFQASTWRALRKVDPRIARRCWRDHRRKVVARYSLITDIPGYSQFVEREGWIGVVNPSDASE
jgi:hypothetical protein